MKFHSRTSLFDNKDRCLICPIKTMDKNICHSQGAKERKGKKAIGIEFLYLPYKNY